MSPNPTKLQVVDIRVKRILALHEEILSLPQKVVICGAELLALRAETGRGFQRIFEKRIARPGLQLSMAYKYMSFAEKAAAQLGVKQPALLLPGKLTGKDEQTVQAARDALAGMDAGTWEQMRLALGGHEEKRRGGNAGLMAWLARNHPDLKAKKLGDVPKEIQEKYEAELAKVRAERETARGQASQRIFQRSLDQCHDSATKGLYRQLNRSQMEHAVKLLNDIRELILKELRK